LGVHETSSGLAGFSAAPAMVLGETTILNRGQTLYFAPWNQSFQEPK
jgi:hypothetical protein